MCWRVLMAAEGSPLRSAGSVSRSAHRRSRPGQLATRTRGGHLPREPGREIGALGEFGPDRSSSNPPTPWVRVETVIDNPRDVPVYGHVKRVS